jgi:hypothetical protein
MRTQGYREVNITASGRVILPSNSGGSVQDLFLLKKRR